MSLFEVPGWSMQSAPVSQDTKKRKRPTRVSTDDVDEAERMQSAQKNIEKLLKTLGSEMGALEAEVGGSPPSKQKRERKEQKGRQVQEQDASRGRKAGKAKEVKKEKGLRPSEIIDNKDMNIEKQKCDEAAPAHSSPSTAKRQRKQKKHASGTAASAHENHTIPQVELAPKDAGRAASKANRKTQTQDGLTALQAKMKSSLDGARFRWINEMLYKSDSGKAHELMRDDSAIFEDYHTGFRHQVESWPSNPVSHYISTLSSYPTTTIIADLGCGDAALARALVPKGMPVLSFDLCSNNAYVIEADICSSIPLPGSETEGEGEAQVVDVVVCALSLMGTNWPGCIREAWRILRPRGELKIAEVTSRFASVPEFISFIESIGFKLKSKDERNTHFTLFEFSKIPQKVKTEKTWEKLLSRGGILKACEYKRR